MMIVTCLSEMGIKQWGVAAAILYTCMNYACNKMLLWIILEEVQKGMLGPLNMREQQASLMQIHR